MKIPSTTALQQSLIYINFTYFDGMYRFWSSAALPLQIQPATLQAWIWTESFAPVVDATVQTFYVYAYYGDKWDFPNSAAFRYPANMDNIIIRQNTTVNTKASNGILIKGSNNAN